MFSNHTPALSEFSSGINRCAGLRNKGNHVVRLHVTCSMQGFVDRPCILCQPPRCPASKTIVRKFTYTCNVSNTECLAHNMRKGTKRGRGRRPTCLPCWEPV